MKIVIHNQTEHKEVPIKKLLKNVFDLIEEKNNMQIILVTREEMQRLNNYYRKKDYVTDVLSFENDDNSLGDIFICVDRATEQAIEYGHSFEREIAFLAVHGYLHLKGFDHETESDEKMMIELQEKILASANLRRE